MPNQAEARAPRTDYRIAAKRPSFSGRIDPAFNNELWSKSSPAAVRTNHSFNPLPRGSFVAVDVPIAIKPIEEEFSTKLARLSFFGKLSFLLKEKPSYFVYLFGTILYLSMYLIEYGYSWFYKLTYFLAPNSAYAQTIEAQHPVINGIDYTPYFFCLVVLLTIVSSYAALFSSNKKTNDNGWDMLKILFGTGLGMFGRPK